MWRRFLLGVTPLDPGALDPTGEESIRSWMLSVLDADA